MPYRIVWRNEADHHTGTFRSKSSARNSEIYKILKEQGFSPRIVKTEEAA